VEADASVAELSIPVLARAPSWEMSAKTLPTPRSTEPKPPPADREPEGPPVLGWTLLGVGAVGLGVGTYFGIRALDKKAESDSICDKNECSEEQAEAVELHDEAVTSAWISNVAIGVGIVGAGLGAFLLLTHDDKAPSSPVAVTIEPRGASVHFTGAW
jgi:serine/threonine-protein kinase